MNWPTIPKNPKGHVPGRQSVNRGAPYGMKIGLITRVDEVNMVADVKILTGGGDRAEIDLTQGMCGPRSFWGGCPEINSLVHIGYRRKQQNTHEAIILGYVPVGNRSGLRFDAFAAEDPAALDPADQEATDAVITPPFRYKRLMLKCGNVGGMSSQGSELVLSKDIRMVNRAGDLFELRDADRTLVSQAIHRCEVACGVRSYQGPARRSGMFFPADLLKEDGKTLKDGYLGLEELQNAGPGTEAGGAAKLANAEGQINEIFNDFKEFPPLTYSNGRQVFYVATTPATSVEDVDAGGADAYTEDRLEMSHTVDCTPEVLEDIDGFSVGPRVPYIERVLGTVAGNDLTSTRGMRQYAKVLKPQIFQDFVDVSPGKFSLVECDRNAIAPDTEVMNSAGAFLFRIRPPQAKGDKEFSCAVTKEGKLYLSASGSSHETKSAKNISAEINLAGALKAYIGASTPDRISAHITLAGALHLDMGRDKDGNCSVTTIRGATKVVYEGSPGEDDVSSQVEVRGVKATVVSGEENKVIDGKKITEVSGMVQMRCDRQSTNAFSGYSLNAGEKNEMITGKSQLQYALAVLSTIAAGGEIQNILAGAKIQNLAAGAYTCNTVAGVTLFNNPGGAFTVTVGVGAIGATTGGGAITLSTGGGAVAIQASAAVAITAGAAMTLTAAGTMTLTAALVQLGAPAATFGVCRGSPGPPGLPTLDPITGTPLLGSPTVHSI